MRVHGGPTATLVIDPCLLMDCTQCLLCTLTSGALGCRLCRAQQAPSEAALTAVPSGRAGAPLCSRESASVPADGGAGRGAGACRQSAPERSRRPLPDAAGDGGRGGTGALSSARAPHTRPGVSQHRYLVRTLTSLVPVTGHAIWSDETSKSHTSSSASNVRWTIHSLT